jgi:hypothetical protein
MADLYVDQPPPADQAIVELHCWIAVEADGGEGIMSGDIEMPGGLGRRHTPLITSKLEVAALMKPMAQRAQALAERTTGRPITIKLVSFRRVDDG